MKRDVLKLRWSEEETLVIASDNSGALGEKQADVVDVPYEVVGYCSFRVAVMECMAARAIPEAVVLHNFNGDPAWKKLCRGIEKGMAELSINELPITGSTESNFSLMQSANGILVIGRLSNQEVTEHDLHAFKHQEVAIIGTPLVGEEVLNQPSKVAPLRIFRWCCEYPGIKTILPVGSKGILYELNLLYAERDEPLTLEQVSGDVDLQTSAGPATCFIIQYDANYESVIKKAVREWFHPLQIK